ncbi:Hypothetical protein CINCED_3A003019 [Cinara cedri]|nr:Hypothetical protein CINCED_3A003019 [Cinara cedri]
MPRLSLDTNIPASEIPQEFLSKCTQIISATLGKNIKFCIATVNPGLKMTLGGSSDPCGFVQVTSIGSLGVEENKKHIAVITDYVSEATGIPKNKLYAQFQSNEPESTGHLGTTFHHLYYVEKGARLK